MSCPDVGIPIAPHATPDQNIHMSFPRGMRMQKCLCAHLRKRGYGTRDASLLWEECYNGVDANGIHQMLGNPMLC